MAKKRLTRKTRRAKSTGSKSLDLGVRAAEGVRGGSRRRGDPTLSDIVITKELDKSSP